MRSSTPPPPYQLNPPVQGPLPQRRTQPHVVIQVATEAPEAADAQLPARPPRRGNPGARIGGKIMGALSVPTAAGYICDAAHYRTRAKALSCAISAPSASYGGTFLRE